MATMHDVETIVGRAVRQGYNVKFESQPALGKTWAITELIQKYQMQDADFVGSIIDCGTLAPTDMFMAIPNMETGEILRAFDKRLPNAYTDPDAHGIQYWGEWNLAPLELQKGLQKYIRKEDCGGIMQPAGIINVLDGNRAKDKSGVQMQSRAIMSGFLVVQLEYDPDYALNVMKTYHERVAAFAIRNPGEIDNYSDVFENPERTENDLTYQEGKRGIWASLRSWNRVSRMLCDVDNGGPAILPDEIRCSIGSNAAAKFEAFCQMLDKLATLEEIIADPKKAAVPQRMDEQFALSTMLGLLVAKDNWENVATYLQRYNDEIQVTFFKLMNDRLAKAKDGNSSFIRNSKTYAKWITAPHISKMLQGAV